MNQSVTAAHLKLTASTLAGAWALALAVPATAQTAAGDTSTTPPVAAATQPEAAPETQAVNDEEIIVSARRRDETLLNVPVAVTALSSQDITRYAATDLSKIGQLVPQVQIVRSGAGTGGAFSIRGVGSSPGDAGIEQTVSVNIDGIQISRGRAVLQSFFDVQQVEVLKGPQALFFGKNSPGGVISVKTAGPTETLQGYAKAGYEFKANERFLEAAVGGPISDTLGFRVAGRASKLDGYIRNNAPDRTNPIEPNFPLHAGNDPQPGGKSYAGRATLTWKPTDSFDLTAKLFANYSKDNAESIAEVVCADPNALPTTLGIPDVYGDCKLNGVRSSTNAPTDPALLGPWPGAPKDGKHYARFNGTYGSLTGNYRTGALTLTSVTGFYNYDVNTWENYDYTSIGLVQSVNDDAYKSISQELRFATDFDSPLNFVGGAYYEHVSRQQETNGRIAPLGPDPRNGKYETWDRPAKNKGDTYSGYGQLIYKFGDAVELAGGVRWTHEIKSIDMRHTFLHSRFPAGIFLPEGVVVAGKFKDTNWSPEATATWHPTTNTTLYVAYKTGYKSGGFSNPSALSANYADINQARFGSETAEGGEIGAKGSFLNGRLSINSALYRYTFDGLQLSSFNAATTTFTIRNAASARTTGAELETRFAVTPDFSVRGSVGYNHARYLKFPTSACYAGQTAAQGCVGGVQNLSGKPLTRAPDWTLSGGFSYDRPVSDGIAIGLSGDANYTDDYFTQENQNPVALQQGFWRLNASVRLHEIDDKWELALIGRNLTDKIYGLSSADKPLGGPGQISQQPSRPREIMLQGTIRF
ncbi:TonB-dependent receptor [Novosphingobium tardum]|uniref:TonB-dependent receptor n=1 Tax=Novosphingobium tardum TaxID=1538021 RepID=A0ABV8RMZ8_9SPHN